MRRPTLPIAALVVAPTFGSSWSPPVAAQEQPRMGGVLKIAIVGEPPTLDAHWTTATITYQVAWHVYETLFTYDRSYEPIPMLAGGFTVSDDGRRYTITLRKGVKFHNGKELAAADAVASLQRWGKIHTAGKAMWKQVEAVEASGDGQIRQLIGTGPYRFVEHKPDRHIKVARFTDYAARSEAPNGFGGRRTAYADEIRFIPVPDVAVRAAGVEAGDYHYGRLIKQDQKDKDKARRLLKEAGYAGQPVRWLTTQEYDHMCKTALVAKQQLEEVGFKVDLQVVDWATLVQRRGKPELYDIFSTGYPAFPGMDPALVSSLQCDWPGWWCHEEKDRLMTEVDRPGHCGHHRR